MDVRFETQRRLQIIENIKQQVYPFVRAMILGGSMGYGQNYSINPDSDIDNLVIFSKNMLDPIMNTSYFRKTTSPRVLNLFKSGELNSFWVTKKVDGVEVNSYMYEEGNFRDFCLLKDRINVFLVQERQPQEFVESYGFRGKLSVHRPSTKFENGWIRPRPQFATNGLFYADGPRIDFFYSAYVAFQQDNFVNDLDNEVWKTYIARLIQENPNLNLEEASLLNAHRVFRETPERLPIQIVRKIKERTAKELTDYLARK